jgi:exonuclease VII large subunit
VAQVALFVWTEQQFKHSLLTKIGEELHQNLQRELPRMQQEIQHDVAQQFERLGHNLVTALQGQIDEKRQEMARIIEQKRDASFSAEQEKQRLAAIGAKLEALRDMALEAAA